MISDERPRRHPFFSGDSRVVAASCQLASLDATRKKVRKLAVRGYGGYFPASAFGVNRSAAEFMQ